MKKSFITSCIIVSSLYCINCFSKEPAKIVGLIPARNESHIIEQCLHALSLYTDAIVYLDDASDDNSVEIVESIAKKYHVERIIKKKIWYRDEPGDKNALLKVGREIGGTHFIVIDADEMFTANCLDNNFLRNKIVALQPGDCLKFVWIQLWRSTQQYRFDNSIWTWNYKDFVLKSMEQKPKLKGGVIGRITHDGARMDKSGIITHAHRHHTYALAVMARELQALVHKGKTGRWYAKGRRGSLKAEVALELKIRFAELLE